MRLMRRFLLSLALLLLLGASVSCSSSPPQPPQASADLDALFYRLRTTQSSEEAQMIEVAIRHVWASSGVASVDTLMAHAVEAMHAGNYDQAEEVLDKVTEVAPAYAEGWNLRATVHYLKDEYGQAVVDIEKVLSIEPRHFGALAGLGRIMLELEDKRAALWAFERALSINPHLGEVQTEVDDLREELAGVAI